MRNRKAQVLLLSALVFFGAGKASGETSWSWCLTRISNAWYGASVKDFVGLYAVDDFPLSAFAGEDRSNVERRHAAFAAQQVERARGVEQRARAGTGTPLKRFQWMTGSLTEKPYSAPLSTPIRAVDAEKYARNAPFRELTEKMTFYDLTKAQAVIPLGRGRADFAMRVWEGWRRFNEMEAGAVTEAVVFDVQTLRHGVILGTVLLRSYHGAELWVHSWDRSELLLVDAADRIARLPWRRTQKESLRDFAYATYSYYHAVPFQKGSAGAGNAWLAGEFAAMYGRKLKFVDGVDRYAQTMRQDDFVDFYLPHLMP